MNNTNLIFNHIKHNTESFPNLFIYFGLLTSTLFLLTILAIILNETIINKYLSNFQYKTLVHKWVRVMISENSSKQITYFDFFITSWFLVLWCNSFFFFFNGVNLAIPNDLKFSLIVTIVLLNSTLPSIICNPIKSKLMIKTQEY